MIGIATVVRCLHGAELFTTKRDTSTKEAIRQETGGGGVQSSWILAAGKRKQT